MNAHKAMTAAPTFRNGLDVTALHETVEAIKADATLARFQFRSTNIWMGGSRNQSTIKGFFGAGREDTSRTAPFVLSADEPKVLLGLDRAPGPLEILLHALGACLTTTLAYQAAAQGIDIEAIDSRLDGDLDLRPFLHLAPGVRTGYQRIRVTMRVRSDAPAETLMELAQFSPTYDVVSNSVPVDLVIEKA